MAACHHDYKNTRKDFTSTTSSASYIFELSHCMSHYCCEIVRRRQKFFTIFQNYEAVSCFKNYQNLTFLTYCLVINKIPSLRALWKIDSCQISSLVKYRRNKKNNSMFLNNDKQALWRLQRLFKESLLQGLYLTVQFQGSKNLGARRPGPVKINFVPL